MELGIANVVAITVLVYIFALGIRATAMKRKWIPVLCGVAGGILGIAAYCTGMPDFPAEDVLTACAVGGASGLAATGLDQALKQLHK